MQELRNNIRKLLDNLDMPQNLKGYNYIVEAICYLKTNKEGHVRVGDIYSYITENTDDTYNRIERAVRHAKIRINNENLKTYSNERFIYFLYNQILAIESNSNNIIKIDSIEESRYKLNGTIAFNSNIGNVELNPKVALDITYALFDWAGLSYDEVDKIQDKLEEK